MQSGSSTPSHNFNPSIYGKLFYQLAYYNCGARVEFHSKVGATPLHELPLSNNEEKMRERWRFTTTSVILNRMSPHLHGNWRTPFQCATSDDRALIVSGWRHFARSVYHQFDGVQLLTIGLEESVTFIYADDAIGDTRNRCQIFDTTTILWNGGSVDNGTYIVLSISQTTPEYGGGFLHCFIVIQRTLLKAFLKFYCGIAPPQSHILTHSLAIHFELHTFNND
jgi:hypothetical protein